MARLKTPSNRPDFEAFVAETTARLESVQALLRKALVEILPADTGARACGRALGLSRHLGWQAWSLAFATDAASAIARLPGPGGWSLLLAALTDAGRPASEVASLRAAVAALEQTVASGSNVTLLRSMSAGALATSTEASANAKARRHARTAAETLHGVRCGLNAVASIIGPVDSRHRLDSASVSLFEELSRSRPGGAWPIYRWSVQAKSRDRATAGGRELSRSPLRPLLPALSSSRVEELGEIRRVDREERSSIEFTDLDPSRSHGLRLVFAEAARRSGRLDPNDEVLASAMVVTLPLQAAVFDVLVHRSIRQVGSASAAIYAPLDLIAWVRNSTTAIPIEESCRLPFEREPRVIESPRLPLPWRSASGAYGDALAQAVAGLGRDLSEYTILRIEVPNPPLHGLVVLRWRQR